VAQSPVTFPFPERQSLRQGLGVCDLGRTEPISDGGKQEKEEISKDMVSGEPQQEGYPFVALYHMVCCQ
jgi:hypothetical protein